MCRCILYWYTRSKRPRQKPTIYFLCIAVFYSMFRDETKHFYYIRSGILILKFYSIPKVQGDYQTFLGHFLFLYLFNLADRRVKHIKTAWNLNYFIEHPVWFLFFFLFKWKMMTTMVLQYTDRPLEMIQLNSSLPINSKNSKKIFIPIIEFVFSIKLFGLGILIGLFFVVLFF